MPADRTGDLLLAVDLGTTMTKVVVFDTAGTPVGSATQDTPVDFAEPTHADADAERMWQVAAGCIRAALAAAGGERAAADRVRAVGCCGFMHSLIAVDRDGHALHRPLLWPDQRCAPQVDELAVHADTIAAITGKRLTTLSSLPRLAWLRDHAPDVLARARAFLLPKDFLRLKLTGEIGTDRRDASGTSLVDAATGTWSPRLLDLAGVDPAQLPPIRPADEVAGEVTPGAAAATGLRAGTPVVVGTGDWPATVIGSGCHLPERTCFYLGSAGILGAFASAAELDRLGRSTYFGSVTSTGTALRWVRDLLYGGGGADGSYDILFTEAERSVAGARDLMFLPHLMGERGGMMRPHARGALYGLSLAHGRPDIVRSVLEGTVLWLRIVSEQHTRGRDIGDLVVYGGGARSPLWRRICAAVFGRPMLLPRVTEGAALGVAMLAATSQGMGDGYLDLARRWAGTVGCDQPDPALAEVYGGVYDRYRTLETTLAALDRTP